MHFHVILNTNHNTGNKCTHNSVLSLIETFWWLFYSNKSKILDRRLRYLTDHFTFLLFDNVTRSLFAKHKVVLAFILCTNLLMWVVSLGDRFAIETDHPTHPYILLFSNFSYFVYSFLFFSIWIVQWLKNSMLVHFQSFYNI